MTLTDQRIKQGHQSKRYETKNVKLCLKRKLEFSSGTIDSTVDYP